MAVATRQTRPASTEVRSAPMKLETRNSVMAKLRPDTRMVPRAPFMPLDLDMAYTVAKAMMSARGAMKRPVIWEGFITSRPVVLASVTVGIAREPKGTGPVLATRHTRAAIMGL